VHFFGLTFILFYSKSLFQCRITISTSPPNPHSLFLPLLWATIGSSLHIWSFAQNWLASSCFSFQISHWTCFDTLLYRLDMFWNAPASSPVSHMLMEKPMVVNSPRHNRKDRAQMALDSPGHVNQQRTSPQHNKKAHSGKTPGQKYSPVRARLSTLTCETFRTSKTQTQTGSWTQFSIRERPKLSKFPLSTDCQLYAKHT